jgi:transposase-like protein
MKVREICRKHGISDSDLLQLEIKVRRDGGFRPEAHEGTRGGAAAVQADVGRAGAGERRDEGVDRKKALRPPGRRQAARYVREERGVSVKRSCDCVGLSRSAYYREAPDAMARDGEVIEALNALVAEFPRWGVWKDVNVLRQRGYVWNHKRIDRVCRGLGLNLPRRTKRRVTQGCPVGGAATTVSSVVCRLPERCALSGRALSAVDGH